MEGERRRFSPTWLEKTFPPCLLDRGESAACQPGSIHSTSGFVLTSFWRTARTPSCVSRGCRRGEGDAPAGLRMCVSRLRMAVLSVLESGCREEPTPRVCGVRAMCIACQAIAGPLPGRSPNHSGHAVRAVRRLVTLSAFRPGGPAVRQTCTQGDRSEGALSSHRFRSRHPRRSRHQTAGSSAHFSP